MIDCKDAFSVLIGGAITLLGTLLAHYLQYRSEQRRLRKERIKERFAEVRRYLTACLEFADLVSIPTTLGEKFEQRQYKEWIKLMSDHLDNWKSLPASGSARVLYVEDEKLLQCLKQIDTFRMLFYINYREFIDKGQMIHLEDEIEELKGLAVKAGARLDKLLDKI